MRPSGQVIKLVQQVFFPTEPSPEPPQERFQPGKQCSEETRLKVLHLGLGSSPCCSFRSKVVEGNCD